MNEFQIGDKVKIVKQIQNGWIPALFFSDNKERVLLVPNKKDLNKIAFIVNISSNGENLKMIAWYKPKQLEKYAD